MGSVTQGSRPRNLALWRWVSKQSVRQPSTALNVLAGALADIVTTGITVKIPWGMAIWVRRFVTGISSPAGVFEITDDGKAAVTPVGGGGGSISSAPHMPRFYSANVVGGTGVMNQTVGDQVAIYDDWYEFDDYREVLASPATPPISVLFQGIWRVQNSSGAAANLTLGPDFIIYDLFTKKINF